MDQSYYHLRNKSKGALCNPEESSSREEIRGVSPIKLIKHINSSSGFSDVSQKVGSDAICSQCLQTTKLLKEKKQLNTIPIQKYAPVMVLSQLSVARMRENSKVILAELEEINSQDDFNNLIKDVIWEEIVDQIVESHNHAFELGIHSKPKISDSAQVELFKDLINQPTSLSKTDLKRLQKLEAFNY